MTIQKRSIVVIALFAAALIIYGMARHYSNLLVLFVVEQTLMQKAPLGANHDLLHRRLHAFLAKTPDRNASMKKLLKISERLEKTQSLTPEELEEILGFAQ